MDLARFQDIFVYSRGLCSSNTSTGVSNSYKNLIDNGFLFHQTSKTKIVLLDRVHIFQGTRYAYAGFQKLDSMTMRLVSGPGMLPLGLRLSPFVQYGSSVDCDEVAEAKWEEEPDTAEPPAKRCKKRNIREQSGTQMDNETGVAVAEAIKKQMHPVLYLHPLPLSSGSSENAPRNISGK